MALPAAAYDTYDLTLPGSALTDAPLLIDLGSRASASFWSDCDTDDGTRGRVALNDGTEIPSHWDPDFDRVANTGWVRFKVSSVPDTGSLTIRVYTPNTRNTAYSASDTYGSENVYNTDIEHYSPDGGGTDSTSNGLDISPISAGNPTAGGVAGAIGAATEYDGTGDYLQKSTGPPVSAFPVTVMALINPDSVAAAANDTVFVIDDGTTNNYIWLDNDNGSATARFKTAGSTYSSAAGSMVDSSWQHVALRLTSSEVQAYRNGVAATADSHSETYPTMVNTHVGNFTNISYLFAGDMQHLMFLSADVGTDWITLESDMLLDQANTWTSGSWTGGDTTPPTLTTATIDSSGTTLTLVFDENVTGQTAFTLDSDFGNLKITAASGDGTDTHTHTLSRPALSTETITLDYDSGTGTSVDDASNALATITGQSVTNNSTMAEAPSGFRGTWKPLPGLSSITPAITIARQNLDITGASTDGTGLILTSTGSFAGITWRPSDTVWISGGTGATPGYYEVDTGGTNNDNQVTLLDSPGTSATGITLKYGAWPIHVMCHAGDTTMSGYTGSEYDELEYQWDFGDSSDTRTYTVRNINSGDDEEISYNDGQYGPMGCYTYIAPGDYTITLNVRGWNGTAYVTASTTATIKVDDWPRGATNRMWFDGASGSDSNDGLDPNGFDLTGAAYNNTTGALTFTGNAATTAFTAAGFSNFEQADQCPDWIYLASGTGGSFTPTLAKILAKVDANEFTLESGLFSGDVTSIATSDGPKQTYGAAVTAVSSTENRRCLLKRGSNYNTTAAWQGQDGCGLADYGDGEKPTVTATADVAHVQPSGSRNAILVRNVEFITDATYTSGALKFTGGTQGNSDVLIYGAEFSGATGGLSINASAANGYEINRMCLWEITKDISTTAGVSGMVFIAYDSWIAIMGGYFAGGYVDPPNNLTHQVYPALKETDGTAIIGIARGMTFGSSDEVNFGLNWNVNNNVNDTDDVRAKYLVVEGCNFQYGQGGMELSNSGGVGNNGQRTRSTDVVIENCCFHAGDGTAALGCVMLTMERVTLRDCRFWYGNQMNALYGTMSDHQFQVYRNKAYVVDGQTFDLDNSATQTGCEFARNEAWMAIAETNADYLVGYYSDSVDNWSVVGNTFYAPAVSTGAYWNKSTAAAGSLSAYNGVVIGDDTEASFDWSDPENGVFQAATSSMTPKMNSSNDAASLAAYIQQYGVPAPQLDITPQHPGVVIDTSGISQPGIMPNG